MAPSTRLTPGRLLTALLAAALLIAGCSSSSSAPKASAGGGSCPYTFALITHGDNGNFWSVVYKGAKDAAKDTGCKLSETYGSQQQGQAEPDDNAENAQIQNAINAKVNGIIVSDHAPSVMNGTLAAAADAGIPVVLVNAGCDDADIAAAKAITCVGQPEQLAGKQAGQRFAKENASNVLCVIHQSGQNLLDRCDGIAQGLGVGAKCGTGSAPASGPACTELILSTPNAASNPQQATGQVTSYLQSHPGINAVMTLNNAIGQALVTGKPANVKIATFDLSQDVQNDLQASPPTMDFAVDQQQYLQGYLPVQFLYVYNKHEGNAVGGGTTVASGPKLVDSSNIKTVAAAIAAGDD
ncbi:MAG: substrate-binding domain-containing protein [Catenulisporales bacterium]|nr:substrate-binding domain-containing protein [Catenulisporales bacterium]